MSGVEKRPLDRRDPLASPVARSGYAEFESANSKRLFDYLVKSFVEDYMRRNYVLEKSGWRSLVEAARAMGLSPRIMYGRIGGFSPSVNELIRRGIVETRSFPGERGRGGVISKLRISYAKKPVQVLVDRVVWGKNQDLVLGLDRKRVAVLPFESISPDPGDEYLADGLSEELIGTMSKIRELSVISRTSTLQFKGRPRSVLEIGRELDAGTVLEGSVRKAGNKVRISVQMVDANDDRHIWSEEFDRDLEDILTLQSEIAQQVATALRIKLLTTEKADIEKRPTDSIDAYQSYLRGRYYLNHFRTSEDFAKALNYFREAIEFDSKCAVAYAGVSHYYHIGCHHNWFNPEDAFPKMKEFARKALEIDSSLAEAHGALGAVYFHYEWNWREAEQEFSRAIELRANYAAAFDMYQHLMAIMGKFDESYELIARGAELSPRYRKGWGAVQAEAMLRLGKVQQGISLLEEVIKANPDDAKAHDILGFAYYRVSRVKDGILEVRKAVDLAPGDTSCEADLGLLLAVDGQKKEAGRILRKLKKVSNIAYVSFVQIASIQYALGMMTEAFENLQRAFERKDIDLPEVRLKPELNKLRSDPRWLSIEARLGLGRL